jgi:outer membrane immunogenic protein
MTRRPDSRLIVKLLLASAGALVLAAGAARAADMPAKAPILKAPPPPTWTGFYAGINAGYSFGNDPYRFPADGFPDGGTSLTAPNGAVLGGQLGYNWQIGNVVLGLEGDAQWTDQKATGCAGPLCLVNQVPESDARLVEHRLRWFATLRGRLGWAHDGWLFYVTGGPAWGNVRETDSAVLDFLPGTEVHDATLFGYAAGLGAEIRLSTHWTTKLEYIHLDLGGMTNRSHLFGADPVLGFNFDILATTTSRVTDDIVRIGLNYQLTPAAPAAGGPWAQAYAGAAPPAAFNWTGLYLGVNAGYGVGRNAVTQLEDFHNGQFLASYAPSTVGPKGGLFGGQAGYNWQMNHVVLGLEGDAQWSGMDDTKCGFSCQAGSADTVSQKLAWFATARARLGWAIPSWMVYATAGGAWGGIDETDVMFPATIAPASVSASFSQTRGGWVAGGGIELRLWERWTGKLEYLHLDLGSTTNVMAGTPIDTLTTTSRIRSDIVRLGLNYKLWN